MFSSVQSLSHVWILWPHGLQHSRLPCPSLSQTHVSQVGDAIQPSYPLSSPSPPVLIFPSIRVFANESVLRIRWPKYWCFNFSISSSNGYSGLICFRIDWFDLLVVQGILNSLLQHPVQKHQFFGTQLSNFLMAFLTSKITADGDCSHEIKRH